MQQRRLAHHALLSVSDKASIVEFAQALSARDVELLSTGGATHPLAEKGPPVTGVSDYTGFPEMMDGCVKTLHPKVHGDILGRYDPGDAIMGEYQVLPIDTVVVNLYPFAQTIACKSCSLEDAVENIDISGPTVMHSAAKDHGDVAIMVENSDYDAIIKGVDANEGSLMLATRFDLAIKAFEHIVAYDSMIANYFGSIVPAYHSENKETASRFPHTLSLNFVRKQDMRYGENSRQQAASYMEENVKETSVATVTQVQGKALSYSDIADTDAVLECVKEFVKPACMTVKHTSPYGVAIGHSILDVYDRAYKADPTSAFGGIIASNHELDVEAAQAIISCQFVKVIIAPSASEEALKTTAAKQSARILTCGQWSERVPGLDFKRVNGDLLVWDRDLGMVGAGELRVVTKRRSNEQGLRDTPFCWKVTKFVKLSTIACTKDNMTIDTGTGQMSRVYSTRIASIKAAGRGLEVKGSPMVSDAFFPFCNGINATAAMGVTYVIQPDGSIHDDEMIAAADKYGITMLFTDMCHFHH